MILLFVDQNDMGKERLTESSSAPKPLAPVAKDGFFRRGSGFVIHKASLCSAQYLLFLKK